MTEDDRKLDEQAATTPAELDEAQLDQAAGGSQSTGAGAGKVTFNPFSITRKVDKSSP